MARLFSFVPVFEWDSPIDETGEGDPLRPIACDGGVNSGLRPWETSRNSRRQARALAGTTRT